MQNNRTRAYQTFMKPTEEQSASIAEFSALDANDLVVVRIRAADNILNRDLGVWGIEELQTLASISPGIPLLLNHDWDRIQDSAGRVFAASVRYNEASSPAALKAINKAGNLDTNRSIVHKYGYVELLFDCYIREYSGVPERCLSGEWSHVSLGGFRYKDLHCPLCNISFYDDACPHIIKHPSLLDGNEDNEHEYAPYHIRKDVFDIGEVSFVTIPNLPAAQLLLAESLEPLQADTFSTVGLNLERI